MLAPLTLKCPDPYELIYNELKEFGEKNDLPENAKNRLGNIIKQFSRYEPQKKDLECCINAPKKFEEILELGYVWDTRLINKVKKKIKNLEPIEKPNRKISTKAITNFSEKYLSQHPAIEQELKNRLERAFAKYTLSTIDNRVAIYTASKELDKDITLSELIKLLGNYQVPKSLENKLLEKTKYETLLRTVDVDTVAFQITDEENNKKLVILNGTGRHVPKNTEEAKKIYETLTQGQFQYERIEVVDDIRKAQNHQNAVIIPIYDELTENPRKELCNYVIKEILGDLNKFEKITTAGEDEELFKVMGLLNTKNIGTNNNEVNVLDNFRIYLAGNEPDGKYDLTLVTGAEDFTFYTD